MLRRLYELRDKLRVLVNGVEWDEHVALCERKIKAGATRVREVLMNYGAYQRQGEAAGPGICIELLASAGSSSKGEGAGAGIHWRGDGVDR